MNCISTRDDATERPFSAILLEGLAPDGGLYLPTHYPQIDAATLGHWRGLGFKRQYQIGTVNSINWARLLAQVAYYFAGYFRASRDNGQPVSFAVPSGNFGNVCAGHVARMMGLPIARLVVATTTILASHDISIDAMLQRQSSQGQTQTELVILTHNTVEGRMRQALATVQALPTVLAPIVSIRKEELS